MHRNPCDSPSTHATLLTVDASVDKYLGVSADNLNGYTGPFGNSFRPLIEQSGLYFLATIAGPPLPGDPGGDAYAANVSATISQAGLLATNFIHYDFTAGVFGVLNPNFSSGAMRFGIGQISSTGGLILTNALIDARYDNLSITLHTVPEPSTLGLFAAAALLTAGLGRRRSRRND